MIHFHPLRIQKVHKETDDCVTITFTVPPDLKQVFEFKQGQNLTIRKIINGEEIRRSYSICNAPFDNILRVAVKRVEGGAFSGYANSDLKAGDILEVMPPTGTFHTELSALQKKKYVAFVAGSGITPVFSIIKTTLAIEPFSDFTLVFGNRTKNNIIFKEELEQLKDKYLNRFRIIHILSREMTDAPINSGRIDENKLQLLNEKVIRYHSVDEFFLCGPEQMVFCVKNYLLGRNIPAKHIHFELFNIPGSKKSALSSGKAVAMENGPQAKVYIRLDGFSFDFDLAMDGNSILDAALSTGADLPYACKGGVCTTCKAKLLEGKITMDANWGLEPDELEKGFILTCQSHPVSEKVVIDFDAK